MAKSAKRRFDTFRLVKKWVSLSQRINLSVSDSLKFGKIYSQDPLDCGNPRCRVCSGDKILKPKYKRQKVKRETREEINETYPAE